MPVMNGQSRRENLISHDIIAFSLFQTNIQEQTKKQKGFF